MNTGWIERSCGNAALPAADAVFMGSRDKPGYDEQEYIQYDREEGSPDGL